MPIGKKFHDLWYMYMYLYMRSKSNQIGSIPFAES